MWERGSEILHKGLWMLFLNTSVHDVKVFEYIIIWLVNFCYMLMSVTATSDAGPKGLEVSEWVMLHENTMYFVYNQGQQTWLIIAN